MDGFIIKKEWLDLIVSGKKTLEIRGHSTQKLNQPIYLLESGTRRVRAICSITSSALLDEYNWEKLKQEHCVDITFAELNRIYRKAYGWKLTNIEPIEDIWHYTHPKGAVIWVKDVQPIEKNAGGIHPQRTVTL